MRATTLKMFSVGCLLSGTLAAVGCHRTPQELERLINEQAKKAWDYRHSPGVDPENYSECRTPTPADARRDDGQAYDAICTERHRHFASFGGNECFPRVDARTVGLFDEGQSLMARMVAGGPVLQVAYLSDLIPPDMSELAAARSSHTVQPCPRH